jgi:hypothetical protein
MSNAEFAHSKKVLDKDSLYSQESFEKARLVITLCRECVVRKFKEFSTSAKIVELVSEEWLVALTFHEYMHAFDQKNWNQIYSKYPEGCSIKIQEGSAMLAEARAYSLLTSGNTSKVMDYFSAFSSSGDQTYNEIYLQPALRLLEFESKKRDSYINGLETGEVDPCQG